MATIPASENEFPEVKLAEGAAPGTPASGIVIAYAKSDGLPYTKDDTGAESPMTPNAHIADTTDAHDASAVSFDPTGLSVITATEVQTAIEELDAGIAGGGIPVTIIDAAGDLIVGTAADTAARLAIGNAGGHLSRINGGLAWDSGTAFPTAAAGDRFWRTDRGLEYYYDGTRWLTTTLYREPIVSELTALGSHSGADVLGRFAPWHTTYDLWLETWHTSSLVSTTNNGTNFWTVTLNKTNVANSNTAITSFSTGSTPDAASTWVTRANAIGALFDQSTYKQIKVDIGKTLTPGNILCINHIAYRLVG